MNVTSNSTVRAVACGYRRKSRTILQRYELTGTQVTARSEAATCVGAVPRGAALGTLRWVLFPAVPTCDSATVLLEVTFIKAPQFDVGQRGQATEFFFTAATFSGSD